MVCNGCTDATAEVANRRGPEVRVLSIPEPSKIDALRLGDQVASRFPRLYVDADVELSARRRSRAARRARKPASARGGAGARACRLPTTSWPVRAFYELWQQLPKVRQGLFGRGVVAVSEAGHRRVGRAARLHVRRPASWPSPSSRTSAWSLPGRGSSCTPQDLGRSHPAAHRAMAGNQQARETGAASERSRTTLGDGEVVWPQAPPDLRVPVFVATTVVSRRRARAARRTGDTTWLRDESSRGDTTTVADGPAR